MAINFRKTQTGMQDPSTGQNRRCTNACQLPSWAATCCRTGRNFPASRSTCPPGGVALAAPVKGNIGDKVIVYLDTLGRVEGKVVRHLADGFALASTHRSPSVTSSAIS